MAIHLSAIKRLRQSKKAHLRNKAVISEIRTLTKNLRKEKDRSKAEALKNIIFSRLDKARKKGIIHSSTVANQKSKIAKFVNKIAA